MDTEISLSASELRALRFLVTAEVGMDYWEDETIRLYRSLGLVCSDGLRITLTEAGMQALASQGVDLLAAA